MPFDKAEEDRASKPCQYGKCPYYEDGEGLYGNLARTPVAGKTPCGSCLIKPELSPVATEPKKWRSFKP